MVWCCDPFEPLTPEEERQQSEIVKDDKKDAPSVDASVGKGSHEPDGSDGEVLVSVTLPPGVLPGQKIEVRSPDGKRTVDTVVPEGMKAGQAFLVKFPASSGDSIAHSLDRRTALPSTSVRPVHGAPVEATVTPVDAETRQEPQADDSADLDDEPKENSESQKADKPDRLSLVRSLEDFLTPKPDPQYTVPKEKKLEPPTETTTTSSPTPSTSMELVRHRSPTSTSSSSYQPAASFPRGQKLIHVEVPPGMPAGSTLFVEIPGENRTVSAQVPPNVTSFHVAYTPQLQHYSRPSPPPQTHSRQAPSQRRQPGREKLLSVRVPPGTPPGTTLHVSVPDEPGRILAAQVPPGNVSRFHVSYLPSEPAHMRGMLPPANAYRGPGATVASERRQAEPNKENEEVEQVTSWSEALGF